MKIRKAKKYISLNEELNELYKAPPVKPRNKEERRLMEKIKRIAEDYFSNNEDIP